MKRVLAREKGAFLTLILIILSLIFSVQAAKMPPELIEQIQAKYPDGLPRYMTPEEQQWLDKQADIRSADTLRVESLGESELMYILPDGATEPPAGAIWAPPEYSSLQGILVRWTTSTSYDTALRGLVAQSSQATYVWCIVKNSTEQTAATTAFTNAGANMSNVGFLTYTADSIWIRDYGPRYFFENNSHAIMDHAYNRPARPYDDGLPEWLAGYWSDPYYDLGLTHGGGNFHCFGNGDAFVSTLILDENPSYSEQDIKDIFRDYLNVDLTIYPRLISNIDATGHIDMWFLPLGDNKVLISEFPTSGYPLSRATTENAAADMAARGYTVYRVPAWNSNGEGSTGGTHYTYTNSVIINGSSKRVIIPSFSGFASQNSAALATFQSAMPDYTIVQVDCTNIIPLAGAVHCIMKHVYPATTPIPTIKVLSANGGEWWKVGTQQQIEWVASDDVSVASVDLYYSTNNGSSWNTIAAGLANTGSYDWTTPAVESAECLIRAVVYDGDSNTREDLSNKVFTISFSDPPPPPIETVYTFSGITNPSGSHKAQAGEIDVSDSMITGGTFPARQGTGITGWANWGEATTAEYAALVSSDDIRYSTVTSGPGYGDNAAMLFEFYVDEEPEDIVQLDVSVEIGRTSSTDLGYAYLWNYSTSSYLVLGTQSGTADMVISKTITTNPANYINPANGQVTVFVVNMNTNALIRTDQIQVTIYSQTSPVMQTLSVSSNSGGSVTTPGEGDFQYVQGTDANIVAAPDLNYHFVNWTGSGVDAGKVADANAADTKITMDADYAVAANFAIDTFSLDYAAGTGGSLTGETSQIVNYGENGTAVTAVPDLGYHFVNWSDDSTDNPRTDLSVTANISVTANFAIDTFTLDYAAGTGGTLAGETSQVVNYGSNGTAVTAIPNIGYYFVRWSDDSTENPRTDLNVTANINVTAIFTMYTFTLDYAAGAGGTLTGDTAQVVAYGSNGTAVTAVPDTGYHFVNWSDASTDNPRTDLNVTDNISVTANFAIDTFTLDYAAGLGGTLTGDTSQVVNYGENGTAVTALPDIGYHFVNWSDASTENPRTDLNITANINVTANFAIDTFTLDYAAGLGGTLTGETSQVVNYGSSGTAVVAVPDTGYYFVNWSDASTDNPRTDLNVTANVSVTANFAVYTFSLDYAAGAGGSLEGDAAQVVDYGQNGTAVTAVPDLGYHFVNWSDDSIENPRTDSNVTASINVTANFAIDTFTLDYAAGIGGTLTGETSQVVDYGQNGTAVTAVPNIGYHFVSWSDDSIENPRTDLSVTANINVTANFAIDTFALYYSAGAGGSLMGETYQVVNYGENATTVTAVPDTGYHFVSWSDDSIENPRTDLNVTSGINVTANFSINRLVIYGYITEPDVNVPIEGVFVQSTNDGGSDTTDANGFYQLTVDYGWAGDVEPSKTGYTFEPNIINYSSVTSDQSDNYIAILDTFIISGYAIDSELLTPMEGVLMTPDDDGGPFTSKYYGGADTTDANGYYEVLVDYNFTGKVTPSKYAYAFEPNSIDYNDVTADITDQNYSGLLLTYTITGYIKNQCDVPIANVTVSAGSGGNSVVTDANGFYEIWVDYNWSGTVTPSKENYTFEPDSIEYSDVLDDITGQNYLAVNIYDLDCDGSIGLGDLEIFCDYWLNTGIGLPADFFVDENDIVDFFDFALFANVWVD